jgi:hypothetical protein
MNRIPFSDISRRSQGLFSELEPMVITPINAESLETSTLNAAIYAGIFRQCECLIKALDAIETLASLVQLAKE